AATRSRARSWRPRAGGRRSWPAARWRRSGRPWAGPAGGRCGRRRRSRPDPANVARRSDEVVNGPPANGASRSRKAFTTKSSNARAPAPAALRPREQVIDRAERVADAVLSAVADEQDAGVADLLAAVGAHAESGVSVGRGDPPGLPMRALQDPGHDVLEAAEGRLALTDRLGGPKSLVAVHRDPTPATDVHRVPERTLAPCPIRCASRCSR